MREKILYYALKYHGEWYQIDKAIKQREPWHMITYDGAYVTIADKGYPNRFRNLENPPWILFYEGDLSLCEKHSIGIVGSRMATAYGFQMCEHIVDAIKNSCVVVSGLAKGIDACAHRHALDHKTIGVIGCGLDISYPVCNIDLYKEMKRAHLILSEYPKGVAPLAFHFPWRNRLIAALSKAVIVVEASMRSGSMLTVNEALKLDIPIYCFPHPFSSESGKGCNFLIAQGANIIVDDDDIHNIFHK